MPKNKKSPQRWRGPDFEPDPDVGEDWDRVKVDPDERDEYRDWREERGSRGRKPRDKAGGRHEKRRRRDRDFEE